MPTINERLAALESVVTSLTAGTATPSTGSIQTVYVQSSDDATQNTRLAALEGQFSSTASSLSTLTAEVAVADADLQAQITALEARVEVLEDKPGGSVAYVRDVSTSLGQIGAENIVTTITTNEASTYDELVLSLSPVGYWRFGETSGTAADNLEGTSAIDGTYTGTYTLGAAGAISGDTDTALTISGAGWVSIPDNALLDLGNGPLSVSLWVKRSRTGTVEVLAAKYSGGLALAFSSANKFLFGKAGTDVIVSETGTTTDTAWHHFVVTKDGATSKLYKDGADVTGTVTDYTLVDNASVLEIGRENGTAYFQGSIDELAIWDRVLSAYEVGQLYTGTGGGGGGGGGAGYVTVSSINALLNALADNTIVDITVTNGTYAVPSASESDASSLYIGSRFAARTNAVLVHAETSGSVTFTRSGGGGCWLRFDRGACYQTWQGFVFANGNPTQTGAIFFGGTLNAAPPHHITLLDIELLDTIVKATVQNDHAIYFSYSAAPGVHDIIIDGLVSNADIEACLHFYHSATGNPNANNVTLRNSDINGANMGVLLWDTTLHTFGIEDRTIDGSGAYGVYHNSGSGITLDTVVTTASGVQGFYSALGTYPNVTGVTFVNCTFDT